MNWCIDKTTYNERMVITNAMYCIFDELEHAETLLNTVIDDCFGERKQKAISEHEAEWMGSMISIVRNILSEAILSYNLTVADTEDSRVMTYLKAAERVKAALACDAAHDALRRRNNGSLPDLRSITDATVNMENTEATQFINTLLENGGQNG